MLKKRFALTMAAILSFALLSACAQPTVEQSATTTQTTDMVPEESGASSESSDKENASGDEFIVAAEIKAPPGKKPLSLPVDQVAQRPLKIATIMVQNNPFGAAVLIGQQWAKEVLADRNCVVDCISVEDFDAQKWTSVIDNCIASGYDAITFFGVSESLQPVVDKGVDAGILMYAFNSEPGASSKRQAWYGQSGTEGGKQCGTALETLMGGEGKYGIITGDFSVLGHEERRLGALEILDANDKLIKIAEVMNNDKAEEAYTQATNMITANPDLKGIYVTAGGPSGAAKAVEDMGLTDQIAVVAHDVLEESAPYIASSSIKACLDQDPFNQGAQPVIDAFNKLVADIDPLEKNFYEGTMTYPNTVKELFPELF